MFTQKTLNDLFIPVKAELETTIFKLQQNLKSDNTMLNSIVGYAFSTGGKHIRPALSLLCSKLFVKDLQEKHYLIAQIAEMIHTASLLHDDVIDKALIRRGHKTVNSIWGNKISVISGDFLLSRASILLASIDDINIIKEFSLTLEEICLGEIQQANLTFKADITWDEYILKSNRKTARLFSSAARGAAMVSGATTEQSEALKDYGTYLGLAFQIVDDILNFYTEDQVGKPCYEDLRSGIITAPVIYALEEKSDLLTLVNTEFVDDADLLKAVNIIKESDAIDKSRQLAKSYINRAHSTLNIFEPSQVKDSLISLAEYVITRDF